MNQVQTANLVRARVEAKLDELLRLWEDDDGEEEDADS
jgi:hypothetical protein